MPGVRLTQRRVHALRPSRKVRDVRDASLKGYGVRVMPSGARRYFIHAQHRGRRVGVERAAALIAEKEVWVSRARGPKRVLGKLGVHLDDGVLFGAWVARRSAR